MLLFIHAIRKKIGDTPIEDSGLISSGDKSAGTEAKTETEAENMTKSIHRLSSFGLTLENYSK